MLYPSCFSQDLSLFAVQSNSSTTSTSFSKLHCNYDVFLSFRGKDTRKNFTDHLYSALVRLGIRTFRDDEELPRGENISSELLNAIRGSKIFIVVFSQGYASSKWCLNELVEIVQCKNIIGHTLLPLFYQVEPSDVRKQTGTFAEAFAMHEEQFQTDMEMVQRWREALTKAANCSGWNLESCANGYYAMDSCTFSCISFFRFFFCSLYLLLNFRQKLIKSNNKPNRLTKLVFELNKLKVFCFDSFMPTVRR
jgi:hypothetical protein